MLGLCELVQLCSTEKRINLQISKGMFNKNNE